MGGDSQFIKIFDVETRLITRKKLKYDIGQAQFHVMKNVIYFIGGEDSLTGASLDTMRSYSLKSEKWEELAPIPDGGRCNCGIA